MNPTVTSQGLLLVLSAPSGAGKTTLAHRLMKDRQDVVFSISYTTRAPRGPERDGIDYHFVDVLTFKGKIERNEFVEWAEVHGHFYGSPQATVEEAMAKKGVALFDIDVQGGHAIRRKHPEAILVYIVPPSMAELERRLRGRGTDAEDTIQRRLLGARSEIERGIATYDYVIVNDQFDRAYEQLRAIVIAERARRGRVDVSGLALDVISPPEPRS